MTCVAMTTIAASRKLKPWEIEKMIEAKGSRPMIGKSTFHRNAIPTAAPITASPTAKYSILASSDCVGNNLTRKSNKLLLEKARWIKLECAPGPGEGVCNIIITRNFELSQHPLDGCHVKVRFPQKGLRSYPLNRPTGTAPTIDHGVS